MTQNTLLLETIAGILSILIDSLFSLSSWDKVSVVSQWIEGPLVEWWQGVHALGCWVVFAPPAKSSSLHIAKIIMIRVHNLALLLISLFLKVKWAMRAAILSSVAGVLLMTGNTTICGKIITFVTCNVLITLASWHYITLAIQFNAMQEILVWFSFVF